MIGEVHDDRILAQTTVVQELKHTGQLVVDQSQHAQVVGFVAAPVLLGGKSCLLMFVFPLRPIPELLERFRPNAARRNLVGRKHVPVRRGYLLGIVRFTESHLQHPGLQTGTSNEFNRVGNDAVGELHFQRKGRLLERNVGVQTRHPLLKCMVGLGRVWRHITALQTVLAPEIKVGGFEEGMVFACQTRAVTRFLGHLVDVLGVERVLDHLIVTDMVRVRPSPGDHACAAGDAQGRRAVGSIKCDSALRETVERRTGIQRVPGALRQSGAMLVGNDEKNVGRAMCLLATLNRRFGRNGFRGDGRAHC